MPRDALCFPAGKARHVVHLQQQERTTDAGGGFAEAWVTYAKVRAVITPASAYEAMVAMQRGENVTHDVLIRYRDGVRARHRILWGARVLDITGVINVDERNVMLRLRCQESDPVTAP